MRDFREVREFLLAVAADLVLITLGVVIIGLVVSALAFLTALAG